jgi:hypothetical protein
VSSISIAAPCALGVHRIAGEQHLHRGAVADALRQAQDRAAAGDERALDLREPEPRPARRDDEVAGQRHLEAARHREALDRRDDRLARRLADDAGEAALAQRHRLAGDERLEVHAGAEPLAGAGDDRDRHVVRAVEVVQGVRDALGHRPVDRVAGIGAVDRDQQDAVAALRQDFFGGRHVRNFRTARMLRPFRVVAVMVIV